MNLRFFSYKLLFLIYWLCTINTLFAQKGNRITLSDKLNQIEKKFKVNLSYNHTFFNTIFLESDFNCTTISECITIIEEKIPVKFEKNDTNYLIIPLRKDFSFTIVENDTNEPITSLVYQIQDKPKQNLTLSNEVFTLKNIFPLDSIHLESYFHKTIHIQAKDLEKNSLLKFYTKQFRLNEIVLTNYLTKGIDSKISDHSIQIKTKNLGLLAGETDGDIFNVISNIPGIHSPSGKSGNLNFRGNTYDQNLVQIDDIPIYHSGHFLGAISPYNAAVIDNIEIQRNMLPVKFGGRVGGLINMKTKNKIPHKNSYEIIANTLFAGLSINTKLLEDKLSLLAAYRTSYPGINSPKLETISTLIFQGSRIETVVGSTNLDTGFSDMNVALNYKINERHSTTVSFINIENDLFAEVREVQNPNQTDFIDLDLDNWGITGKWKAQFSDKLSTELRFSKSNMRINNISEGFARDQRFSFLKYENIISDTRFIAEATYSFNPNTILEGGYNVINHELTSNEMEQENNLDLRRDQKATIHSTYLSFQKNWNDKLNINFGFHNNYYTPSGDFYVNPRLTASYAIHKRLYVKSSLGTSNQFIQKKFVNDFDDFNITNQFWFLPNREIAPLKGTQFMFGAVFNPKKWLIDLEFFKKESNNITKKIDNKRGSISSIGADVFVKKTWNKIEAWISYSLSKTETTFDNTTSDAFFDQRHILNLTSLLNLNKWKFALSWRYFSGMPVIYPNDPTINTSNLMLSDRFDGSHQLDFSSSYTFYNTSKSFKTVIGLSILNVYDQDNTVNIFQNPTANTFRKTSSFAPNLQVNLSF
ncbi:TonB-dependent receptor plug domain-containing protein [Tenacibaculum agarivorans]|uniref:TonB-dependent receptor plug domain-containing protein n=1 Tax=Tenacibaculum agarivorans TaxID=1908389 RepID=UPI00094B9E86|nr:TonB-dependent receptor plug domain-containing protein [Tenacibaculum agarivorans]